MPNFSFFKQLIEFEKKLKQVEKTSLVESDYYNLSLMGNPLFNIYQ